MMSVIRQLWTKCCLHNSCPYWKRLEISPTDHHKTNVEMDAWWWLVPGGQNPQSLWIEVCG